MDNLSFACLHAMEMAALLVHSPFMHQNGHHGCCQVDGRLLTQKAQARTFGVRGQPRQTSSQAVAYAVLEMYTVMLLLDREVADVAKTMRIGCV